MKEELYFIVWTVFQRMIWTGIIIITLSFADCLAPDSPESEPEPAPVESEEIDSIEPDEIEEVKAIVTIDAEAHWQYARALEPG